MPTHRTPERFATEVGETLASQQRKIPWLAEMAGVPEPRLRYQLKKPSALTLRTALAVSDALGVEL